jgi:hypothetical protein
MMAPRDGPESGSITPGIPGYAGWFAVRRAAAGGYSKQAQIMRRLPLT